MVMFMEMSLRKFPAPYFFLQRVPEFYPGGKSAGTLGWPVTSV